ncbi:non-specific serine/threonine protein kinase [Malassezia cuniculi]|uniref:non-specific serine/threonine protein kinase n=1 Tax=Malassezia cuniculi TaxID=948313 RepID=A0AAF0EQE3_9BASI|nr:non-specific serine/threonine protein kinase [Malassezia cuniculi]
MRCLRLWHAWWGVLGACCVCAYNIPYESQAVSPVASVEHADLELGNIALVATIDGALHGLDRSTGQQVWAIGDDQMSRPLVHSTYGQRKRSFDEVVNDARNTGDTETLKALRGAGIYIVEPSTGGDLYMLRIREGDARPRLEKLPFTLPQLVDLSPFSFSSDDARIYVAHKHTRLVELNVFTGKIGAVFDSADATSHVLSSTPPLHAVESPWVFVGRTDYTLTVHLRNVPDAAQTVSYSVYVPNTADADIAALWHNEQQAADSRALLPAPDKLAVTCFDLSKWKGTSIPPVAWQHTFDTTPVAVFDTVFVPESSNTHLLRPVIVPHEPVRLGDVFSHTTRPSTYLGIAAGGSLFALGASKYPLVELSALAGTREALPALPSGPLAGIVGGYDVHLPRGTGGIPLLEGARPQSLLPPPPPQPFTMDARLIAQIIGFIFFVLVILRGYVVIQRDRSPIVLSTETLSFDERPSIFSEEAKGASTAVKVPQNERRKVSGPSAQPEPKATEQQPAEPAAQEGKEPDAQPAKDDEEDGDGDGDDALSPQESDNTPRRRRRRRGKRAGAAVLARQSREEEESTPEVAETRTDSGPVGLELSNDVLGYGSSGTVVFRGKFQGRAVAVKRLLRDFVEMASKEVSLLESADNHPNVIRYFYQELTPNFLFIALEQCPASLADLIERPLEHAELSAKLEPRNALQQIAAGLRHLHSLSIVHRDIKPQNILVAPSSDDKLRMLLSDFGLSKRIDGIAQNSFSQTVNQPGGTAGWRAPEVLRGDTLDVSQGRLTRAVDIFSLGCVAFYLFTHGGHPFGTQYEREMNIMKDKYDLSRLAEIGEDVFEAQALVGSMIQAQPQARPSAVQVTLHPFFWNAAKRLAFLQDVSDRFETLEKEPPAPPLVLLERDAKDIVGADWRQRFDKAFLDDLGRFRKYDGASVRDLLRVIRNKRHHFQDMAPQLKRQLSPMPEGFMHYFSQRFPRLFLHVHAVIEQLHVMRSEPLFRTYFADE